MGSSGKGTWSLSMISIDPPGSKAPIGIFDSGFGGLTVMREIVKLLPREDYLFLGDCIRCPYGPRPQDEVRDFVLRICSHLVDRGCKLIVIACNTATAAGLHDAQMTFDIPIVGVVVPGSRAAVQMTKNRRVGVIATEGTIASGVYEKAIHALDAGIKVFSRATPEFVAMAEAGLRFRRGGMIIDEDDVERADALSHAEYLRIAEDYLLPLKEENIDTLVLGCTHYPLIQPLIADVMGPDVKLVSSAEETAREVHEILKRRGELLDADVTSESSWRRYLTTDANIDAFKNFGSTVMGEELTAVEHIVLAGLEDRV